MTDQPTQPADAATDASTGAATEDEASEQVMDLLSEHVPLSLIMDLSSPAGPDSEQILEAEGEPDDAWWEPVSSDDTASEPA